MLKKKSHLKKSAAKGVAGLPFQSISDRSTPLSVRIARSFDLESSWGISFDFFNVNIDVSNRMLVISSHLGLGNDLINCIIQQIILYI